MVYASFVISVVTLIVLIWYAWLTRGIEKASNKQAKTNQGLATWQPKQWELDSRKQEWSELIGTLTKCVHRIELAKAGTQSRTFTGWLSDGEVQRALLEAAQVIQDRLFIRDVLDQEHIEGEWKEIEKQSDLPPVATSTVVTAVFNFTDFQQIWKRLHEKLVSNARRDLKIG